MKKTKQFLLVILMIASYSITAQVGINTDESSPDGSAMLDVKSTDKGILIPRMTQAEIETIESPANGLTVFNTDNERFYFFAGSAGVWKEIAIGTGTITPVTPVVEVFNPVTGETWMDRNLGAMQVATSKDDAAAYGYLYQWGRGSDGHENRNSDTTSSIATTAVTNAGNSWDGLFITDTGYPYDWLTPQDNTLWQGVSGTNNPCPDGFRIPTEAEWEAERNSWPSNDGDGAFASPLKLVLGSYRQREGNGWIPTPGFAGNYHCSNTSGTMARYLFVGSNSFMASSHRGYGKSIRCIKD